MIKVHWPGVWFFLAVGILMGLPFWMIYRDISQGAFGMDEDGPELPSETVIKQREAFFCPACDKEIDAGLFAPLKRRRKSAPFVVDLLKVDRKKEVP